MVDDRKKQEIHLLDYFEILVRYRWFVVRNFFITVLVVALISLVLPKKYVAVATLMPPQEQSKSSMESLLAEVSVPGLPLPMTSSSSSDVMVEILKSRSVGERVLLRTFKCGDDSLPLYKCLKFPSVQVGLLKMKKKVKFNSSQQGLISIAVELGDRQLAADVANAYVEELDRINQEKSVSRAKNSRIYLESQLQQTQKKLSEATRKLADFRAKYKAVSLEEQMKVAIQTAGELKGQMIAKEVQIGVMLQTMKPQNPLVIRAQKELEELRRRYYELQDGVTGNKARESEFYLPFDQVPEIGLQLAELTREAKVQETVWELLNQQYYQAKIQEARDTPTIQVLDPAVPPIVRSSPKRKLLVIVFGALSLLVSIVWIYAKEYVNHLDERPEEKQTLLRIKSELAADWGRFKNKLKITNK